MSTQLPLVPSIDHLRYQARNLHALCRVGDRNAVEQIRQSFTSLSEADPTEIAASVRLCHAQGAIALKYGYGKWSDLCESVEVARCAAEALSTAIDDPRMNDLDYRATIARRKGLPELGSSRISEHGVRYDVVDYMPAITPTGAARVRAGGAHAHINDLLPIISFPEMSDRLYELYIETDCITTKPLIFFDTVPSMHPSTAVPGLNQVLTTNNEAPLHIHFDAAQLHETIIAHELGHVWIEKVQQVEDFRHPRDQSDLSRITQFYHVQSFVMDLCVNDLLERRGFDMSIIARHQAEAICNFGAACARGEKPKGKRVLAAVINAIAGALLEMERFPAGWSPAIRDALAMIEIGLPEAFGPAKGFVRSVLQHGYSNSAAVMRVVDDCARLSLAATGESFDPEKDLVEVTNQEPEWDKRPEFLKCLPLGAKLEVCREAARAGITGRAKYDIVVSYPHRAEVVVSDPGGEMLEPIRLNYCLPAPPPNPHLMGGGSIPNIPIGSAYVPPPGFSSPQAALPHQHVGSRMGPGAVIGPVGAHDISSRGIHPLSSHLHGLPDPVREIIRAHTYPGAPGHEIENAVPGPSAEVRRSNDAIARSQAELHYRQKLLQQAMMERHYESYSGADIKPLLTPPGEEYSKLHPRRSAVALEPVRNYMAGLGRWISQVGFEQQMAGEPSYGYANNNPVTYVDPDGRSPQQTGTHKPSIGKGGSGNSCPGAAAYNLILTTYGKNKACLREILKVCWKGFPSEVSLVPFKQCDPPLTKGESGTACDPNAKNPPPGSQRGRDQKGKLSTCFVGYICFNPDVCSGKNLPKGATVVGRQAGDLLYEMINWCNCKYHSDAGGEGPANHVIDICKIPGDTGSHGGGFE